MTKVEFVAAHPRLYHMATSQALPTLKKYGLLSTDAILELCGVAADFSDQLRSMRRSEMTSLQHPEHGVFYLRDQKPMRDAALENCLDGMTVPEWYRCLNSRVFMWASKERVDKLLAARAYRKNDQLVLTIHTASLVERYFDRIEVTTLNSGATLYTPLRRGLQTFVPLQKFDAGKGSKPIVEVTVPGSIPDLADFIENTQVRKAATI